MEIGRIQGATRVLGRSQGYYGLPVRDSLVNSTVTGEGSPMMETAWIPSIEDMQAMVKGAPIILQVMGTMHPPVTVKVGDVPA